MDFNVILVSKLSLITSHKNPELLEQGIALRVIDLVLNTSILIVTLTF